MTPLRWFGMGFAACLLVIGIGLLLYDHYKKPDQSVLAQPAKELKNAKTETLTCRPVIVYKDVEKKLGLPAGSNVVAATKLPGDDHPSIVTAVYDSNSGAVTQYVRRDPLPILSLINQVEIGAAYGIKSGDGAVVRIDGQWDLVQIKALKAGMYGQVDSDGTGMVGVRAHIRF